MTDKIVVLNTCSSREEALQVARTLLDARLAACVSVVPGVQSLYRWQGAIEEAAEWLLVVKTRRDLFEALAAALKAAHSYETPEIVALPVVAGSEPYLDWIARETGGR